MGGLQTATPPAHKYTQTWKGAGAARNLFLKLSNSIYPRDLCRRGGTKVAYFRKELLVFQSREKYL